MFTVARAAVVVSLASFLVVVSACSGSETSAPADPGSSSGGGGEGGTPSGDTDAGKEAAAPPAPPGSCTFPDVTGVNSVTPTFKIYKPPSSAPDAMTGGAIAGTYKVDAAVVYLPQNLESAIKLPTSTGTLTAWAFFKADAYKFNMSYDFSIDSVLGVQSFKDKVIDSGTFKSDVEKLVRLTTCDPAAPPQNAELSFTDKGTRGTIVVKTTVQTPLGPGDVYIQLEAAKTP